MTGPRERWIAPSATPLATALGELDAASALTDGRVFVSGRRAHDAAQLLAPGDVVEVYAARADVPALGVLYRGAGLAVVDKPAGMATEPERRGRESTVVSVAAKLFGVPFESVHALSRLDVGVSGVVLLGLDPAARSAVNALREQGRARRRYVALATGALSPEQGIISDPIQSSQGQVRRRVGGGGEPAETRYEVIAAASGVSLIALEPRTGRTHQLRVHCAAHGAPLLGDRTYGGSVRRTASNGAVQRFDRIFLHAAWLELDALRVESPLPAVFAELWSALGGDERALRQACD